MTGTTGDGPERLARLAGAMYLLQIVTGTISELVARSPFLDRDNAAHTAANILAAEHVFRMGIVGDLVTYLAVLVATWALYILLKSVDRKLAVLALMFRLIELSIHVNVTLNSLAALRLLDGTGFLAGVDPAQLQVLAQQAIGVQGAGLRLGFIPLGLGSAIFAWLLYKSRYVPRVLAAWGIFASLVLSSFMLAAIVYPAATSLLYIPMAPMGLYEIALGFWLLFLVRPHNLHS